MAHSNGCPWARVDPVFAGSNTATPTPREDGTRCRIFMSRCGLSLPSPALVSGPDAASRRLSFPQMWALRQGFILAWYGAWIGSHARYQGRLIVRRSPFRGHVER